MDADATETMAVAALGRPFSLGMLYDCRKDSLIPGMTLWDLNDLKNDIQEKPQHCNDFQIVASESIADKSSALNVEASLKASFLGGLVEVGGSAKYLKDSKTSKNQARVTLTYQATTKMKQLSMNHLGTHNVKHRDVIDKKIATHVVTGILYGAQAFFVFDREVSDEESHHDIQGKMKMMIKKIPKLTIEGEGSLKMKDEEKESVEKFSCKFHGDFLLEKTPTSFQDAIQVYQSLPNLLGTNGENAVPMKVWLMPLVSLDSDAAKLVRQISIRLVQESQSVLEDFTELEMRCNDAMRTTTAQQFPQIGKKLKTFAQFCSEYKLEFQQNLAKKLPLIRGGGEEEAVLAEILKKRHSSPFNNKSLNEWMDCKEREIYTVLSFTNKMNNTRIVSSQSHLNREILSTEHAVCFVFTSLGSAEPYLSDLLNYLKETPKPDDPQDPQTDDVEREQWYTSKEVSDAMRKKAKLFSDFAEANKEKKNIKFLTVGLTNETQKGSSIYVYEDGFSVSENFELPSKPETVTAGDVTHNSVRLKICPPRFGSENITSYSVEYCVSGEDGWQQKPASKAEEVTVSDLTPNTEYMFRCRAVTSVGVGPAGEVSGPIKTLPCSPPGKPHVEANPAPPSPTFSVPRRKISWGDKERDLQYVRNYQPENTDVKHLRILLYGPVGVGKSSFISSVVSAVRGRMGIPALDSATVSGRSHSKKYKTHRIQKESRGNFYPFVFNNIMGLEERAECGVRVEDIKLALKGHVREGYEFNPASPLSDRDPGYISSPSEDDKVHVLVCVCDANASEIKGSVMQKMREIREAASDLGIPQVAVVTKVDEACGETQKDLKNVYKSKYLKKKMKDFSARLGIPLNCIFAVKNYSSEISPDEDVDTLILNALRLMIDFGDDFINKM